MLCRDQDVEILKVIWHSLTSRNILARQLLDPDMLSQALRSSSNCDMSWSRVVTASWDGLRLAGCDLEIREELNMSKLFLASHLDEQFLETIVHHTPLVFDEGGYMMLVKCYHAEELTYKDEQLENLGWQP